jgi:hypothetical protein
MTNSPAAPRWVGTTVALMTTGWVLALLASVWWCFGIAMEGWADSGEHSAELDHRGATAATVLALVAVGGPALIAVVAFAGERGRIGAVYVVLALVLGVLALPVVAGTGGKPAPPTPTPSVCQEHSGGGNECPGG